MDTFTYMKGKILHLLAVVTSLFGYLEWSGDSHSFLYEAEIEVLSKLLHDPLAVLHPFTLLPMAGQVALLVTLFLQKPHKWLTYFGIGGLGLLLAFMLLVGVLSLNYKIVCSTIPFLVVAVLAVRHQRATES
jgi:hypothetical protein